VSPRIQKPASQKLATLLVVDDEELNRQLLSEVLGHAGYATLAAGDGAQAVQIARTSKPDGMLLDLMMPGIDGFEVLRRLRADPATQNLPVLVITALQLNETQREFLARNAQDVFQKGTSGTEDLLARITRMLTLAREAAGNSNAGAGNARGANS